MTGYGTATQPDNGVVHYLRGDGTTLCGMAVIGWSIAVTDVQRLGLVLFCEACEYAGREGARDDRV